MSRFAALVLALIAALSFESSIDAQRAPDAVPPTRARRAAERASHHRKIESGLEAARTRLRAAQADRVAGAVPAREGQLAVTVRVREAGERDAVEALIAARGGTVANARDTVVEARVPPEALDALAALDGVTRLQSLRRARPDVYSQGASGHNVPNWQANGYYGTGVKVGIIDGGFIGFQALMGHEVPASVIARCYTTEGVYTDNLTSCETDTQHGAAVTETIFDEAPGATYYIANPYSPLDLQNVVSWMAAEGVQVINYSMGWTWDGPGNGTSPYADSPLGAVAIAANAGIVWVNSAGNSGLSTWTGKPTSFDAQGQLLFSPGNVYNPVALDAGYTAYIQARWEDSWDAAARDIDLCLYTPSKVLIGCTYNPQGGLDGDEPYEALTYTPSTSATYYVTLEVYDMASNPGWAQVQAFSGETLGIRQASYSIGTPADAISNALLSVGAAEWSTPTTIEDFSSQGPTTDGRPKPEITGLDGAATVTYPEFFGTSQSAPHLTGLAALVRQAFPAFSASDVTAYLKSHASSRSGANVWGAGLAMLPRICHYALSPSGTSFTGSGAASGSFTVTTQDGCEYDVAPSAGWLHVTSASHVASTSTVSYTVDANAGAPRTATINAAGQAFTVAQGVTLPTLAADRTALRFGAVNTAAVLTYVTDPQVVSLTQSGAGVSNWTVQSDVSWLDVQPASGNGSGQFTVSVVNRSGILPPHGSATGTITVTPVGVSSGPIALPVTVATYPPGTTAAGHTTAPFGLIDTPANNATGIQGTIGVTGWALDDVQVASVKIYRDRVSIDPPAAVGPNGKVYIGDATFIPGARPDVEGAYADRPLNYRAGWGLMMLTNMLPDLTAHTAAGGRGAFTLYVDATDADGHTLRLGSRHITVNNSALTVPFGTLDTPTQGGVASGGAFLNFGWALAPLGRSIPTDGSTLGAWIDGIYRGQPSYDHCRAAIVNGSCTDDIATLFPAYANKNGAIGVFAFDTTGMANGLHTISWNVADNTGATTGIGSRFFTVFNGSTDEPLDAARATADAPALGRSLATLPRPSSAARVSVGTGFSTSPSLAPAAKASGLRVRELDRAVARVDAAETAGWSAYQSVRGTLRALPVGATFDRATRTLSWQLGAGFVGAYDFAFVRHDGARAVETVPLRVVVGTVREVRTDLAPEVPSEIPEAATEPAAPVSAPDARAVASPEPATPAEMPAAAAAATAPEAPSAPEPRVSDATRVEARAVMRTYDGGRAPQAEPAAESTPVHATVTLDGNAILGAGVTDVRWSLPSGDREGVSISIGFEPGDHVVTVSGVRDGVGVSETVTVHVERAAGGEDLSCSVTRADTTPVDSCRPGVSTPGEGTAGG